MINLSNWSVEFNSYNNLNINMSSNKIYAIELGVEIGCTRPNLLWSDLVDKFWVILSVMNLFF